MSLIKNLYGLLPVSAQTLALNIYAVRNRIRMSKWKRYLSEIEWTERSSRTEQVKYTADKLRVILSHAVRTVPRYEKLKPLLVYLDKPESDVFKLMAEFPVTTRFDVLEEPDAYLSKEPGSRRLLHTITSGTTGTPFSTWMDIDTFNRSDALWWRRNEWCGYKKGEWIARLVGDPIIPLSDHAPRHPWRISWIDRRLYMSSYHLNRETAEEYLDVLERRRPEFLMGYPSTLEILAGFCESAGRTLKWRPRAVWFASEPMFPHQRSPISRVFRAPIVGLYGCSERLLSAAECEEGNYHLSVVDGFLEGQFGIMDQHQPALLTTLMNRVMPLIRFELGDVIKPLPYSDCSCGRTLPVMDPVVTKHEDWLETPSGRKVSSSSITWAFKDVRGVKRSQVLQTGLDTVEVHLDTNSADFTLAARMIEERLGKMLFGEMKIKCVRDVSIKVTKAGKSRFVVRQWPAQNFSD